MSVHVEAFSFQPCQRKAGPASIPAVTEESVLDRHWKEMFERMGDAAPNPSKYGNDYKNVTLQMMLDHNINEFTNDFEELSTAAAKQHGLKKAMGNMKIEWQPLEFLTAERNGVPLLRGIDEIQTVLDDHISKTQAIRSSRILSKIPPCESM